MQWNGVQPFKPMAATTRHNVSPLEFMQQFETIVRGALPQRIG